MSETTTTAVDTPTDLGDGGTTRDRVWNATLSLLADRPLPFQAWRVRKRAGLEKSHERTIRRTLSVMAAAGWLDHDDGSKWWYPGAKARERFDVGFPGSTGCSD